MEDLADIETSSAAYAQRFSGPAGQWLLNVQTKCIFDLLSHRPGTSVLDVGGGHAQVAVPLAKAGYRVTVLGSDPVCAARLQPLLAAGTVRFRTGSLTRLPFPDRSFDIALSVRLVPHCSDWEQLIGELCRVARCSVVVDYPCAESINCLAGHFFERKKKMEGNTRTWITFRHAQIRRAFERAGWSVAARRKQFFWPMVFHRQLGSPAASRMLEAVTGVVGFRRAFGSPVLVRAEPSDTAGA